MAKARTKAKLSEVLPKLVFRENGSARGEKAETLKETNVELNWVHVNRSQTFKTVFLGDSNVGKTCLARLFVEHKVLDITTNTIGFDHHVKEVQIEENVPIKLQIWDTAGMEQFRNALITKYYRNADGIVLVYDITRRDSFENLEMWIKEVKQYCTGGLERIRMILIGNKLDLEENRQVSVEEAQQLSLHYKMAKFIEISAKLQSSLPQLDELFQSLGRQMVAIREKTEMTKSAKFAQESVIRLGSLSEEWEVISTPDEPVPHYAYRPQEEQRNQSQKCSRC